MTRPMNGRNTAPKGSYVPPLLMSVFGVLALLFGIWTLLEVRANPEPLAIACDGDALSAVAKRRWVQLDGCDADWDAAVERSIQGGQRMLVPLRRRDDGALVGIGVFRSTDSRPSDVFGMTRTPIEGTASIELGVKPMPVVGWTTVLGGILLAGLAVHYFRRARREASAAAAGLGPATARPATTNARHRKGTFLDRGDDFNFALFLAVPPLVGIGMLVGHFARGTPAILDPTLVAICIVPFGVVFAWVWQQQRAADRFAARVHRDAARLPADAEVVVYDAVISMLAVSMRFPSRPLIVGVDATLPTRLMTIAITLVFGWWGLPWGPFLTVRALVRNLRGGTRDTLANAVEAGPTTAEVET